MRVLRNPKPFRTVWRTPAAGLSAILLTLVLSACGVVPIGPTAADRDPHNGVARAHQMPVLGIDVSRWQGTINGGGASLTVKTNSGSITLDILNP